MDIETWLKVICPNCNAVNWLCNGDVNDLTQLDVEGFTCHDCGKSYSLDGEEDLSDEEYYDVGEEKP